MFSFDPIPTLISSAIMTSLIAILLGGAYGFFLWWGFVICSLLAKRKGAIYVVLFPLIQQFGTWTTITYLVLGGVWWWRFGKDEFVRTHMTNSAGGIRYRYHGMVSAPNDD
jgi:hypothetical protein